MWSKKIRPWRRLAEISQAVVIIGLPFLTVKGESALRFDVPALELHFFGITLWMEEFFIVLIAVIFVSLLIIFITVLLGRIWCGWMCPQTVISDFTAFIERTWKMGIGGKIAAYGTVILVSVLVAANLIWYFVSPYEFIAELVSGSLGSVVWGFWTVLTVLLALNFMFLRRTFCATVCPYAKLQGTLFDSRTLLVAFDQRRREECSECMACVRACPVGIDIRSGTNAACIHCAECIDTCSGVMDYRRKKSLIGYFFGQPGTGGKLLRQNVVLIGGITFAFFLFLLYLLIIRNPLDVTVLPNYSYQPRMNHDGSVINSYILSIKNRGREDEKVTIRVSGAGGSFKIIPDKPVSLAAETLKRVPVYVSLRNDGERESVQDIDIIVASVKHDGQSVRGTARFVIPDKP